VVTRSLWKLRGIRHRGRSGNSRSASRETLAKVSPRVDSTRATSSARLAPVARVDRKESGEGGCRSEPSTRPQAANPSRFAAAHAHWTWPRAEHAEGIWSRPHLRPNQDKSRAGWTRKVKGRSIGRQLRAFSVPRREGVANGKRHGRRSVATASPLIKSLDNKGAIYADRRAFASVAGSQETVAK
jgi:hypothetical protein